jgi:hypothetical protein
VFSDVVRGDLRSEKALGRWQCKGLTVRHLYKSFGVKGLIDLNRRRLSQGLGADGKMLLTA